MKTIKNKSGQSLVEFALIIPILLFVILVFLDLGRAFYYQVTLSNAVREGARFAIVSPSNMNEIVEVVRDYSIAMQGVTVSVQFPGIKTTPLESYIIVEGSLVFNAVTPGLRQLIGSPTGITLRSQSRMQMTPFGFKDYWDNK